MADPDNAFQALLADWLTRNKARAAAFNDIRFGEKGYYQRAVDAVTPMLKEGLAVRPKEKQAGRLALEVLPMLMRSEQAEITNESVEELINKAATDFYSYQQLVYLASNPVLLQNLPAFRKWKHQVDLGVITPPLRPRGQHKVRNHYRNKAICMAIAELAKLGFFPYRNKLPTSTCASDVVAEALTRCGHSISYDGVAEVWKGCNELKARAAGTEIASDVSEQLLAFLSVSNKGK